MSCYNEYDILAELEGLNLTDDLGDALSSLSSPSSTPSGGGDDVIDEQSPAAHHVGTTGTGQSEFTALEQEQYEQQDDQTKYKSFLTPLPPLSQLDSDLLADPDYRQSMVHAIENDQTGDYLYSLIRQDKAIEFRLAFESYIQHYNSTKLPFNQFFQPICANKKVQHARANNLVETCIGCNHYALAHLILAHFYTITKALAASKGGTPPVLDAYLIDSLLGIGEDDLAFELACCFKIKNPTIIAKSCAPTNRADIEAFFTKIITTMKSTTMENLTTQVEAVRGCLNEFYHKYRYYPIAYERAEIPFNFRGDLAYHFIHQLYSDEKETKTDKKTDKKKDTKKDDKKRSDQHDNEAYDDLLNNNNTPQSTQLFGAFALFHTLSSLQVTQNVAAQRREAVLHTPQFFSATTFFTTLPYILSIFNTSAGTRDVVENVPTAQLVTFLHQVFTHSALATTPHNATLDEVMAALIQHAERDPLHHQLFEYAPLLLVDNKTNTTTTTTTPTTEQKTSATLKFFHALMGAMYSANRCPPHLLFAWAMHTPHMHKFAAKLNPTFSTNITLNNQPFNDSTGYIGPHKAWLQYVTNVDCPHKVLMMIDAHPPAQPSAYLSRYQASLQKQPPPKKSPQSPEGRVLHDFRTMLRVFANDITTQFSTGDFTATEWLLVLFTKIDFPDEVVGVHTRLNTLRTYFGPTFSHHAGFAEGKARFEQLIGSFEVWAIYNYNKLLKMRPKRKAGDELVDHVQFFMETYDDHRRMHHNGQLKL